MERMTYGRLNTVKDLSDFKLWSSWIINVISCLRLVFSDPIHLTRWVIGLEFVKAENVNVDLTYDIQNFTDIGKHCKFSKAKTTLSLDSNDMYVCSALS